MENLQGSAARSRVHVLAVNGKKSGFPTVSAGVLQGLLKVLRKVRKVEKRAVRERAALREFAQTYLFDDRESVPCAWSSMREFYQLPHMRFRTGGATGQNWRDLLEDDPLNFDDLPSWSLDAPQFIPAGAMHAIMGKFETFPAPVLALRSVLEL